jgi:hypothetical protein
MSIKPKLNTSSLWDINKPSFLMVVLPYIGFNWRELYESPFYSLGQAGLVLLVLIVIELLFTQLVKKTGKYEQLLSLLFIGFTTLFFYGNNFLVPVSEFISGTLHLFIREKIIFLCIALLILALLYFIFSKNKNWKVLNVFLAIYCVVNIFSTRNLQRELIRPIESIQNGYKDISRSFSPNEKGNEKPIILIVMDEYSSPDELYKIIKDSAVYDFSNNLKKAGWEVRNSSYTYEKSTIHSISSLFNFNLSKDSSYGNQKNENIISKKMMKAALMDSLSSKGVSFSNYSIFHLGSTEPLTQLYLYPTSFTEHFLIKTSFAKQKILSNNFKFKNLIKINSNVIEHNNYILNELSTQLEANKNKKNFTYAHLFMPHPPFDLGAEFPIKHSINFENYFLFWKFNNTKVEALLNSINKVGDYRIILTGDHGFRKKEHNENFHYTFTAFKGFDSLALKQIESIQDIGLLINAGFK